MADVKEQGGDESFRDHLYNVAEDGKRLKIYPKKPAGRFYRGRTWFSWLLLVLLFSGPFIKINGHQLLLLNILERKFVLFGIPFWPQDFHLVVLSGLTLIVFIVLFTAIYGRVWCGWACPQTIFLEMVFRKIEYLIEGDAPRARSLDRRKTDFNKVWKKALKHSIFFTLSFLIANVFLAYIIGSDELITIITDPIDAHIGGLLSIVIFSLVFYGVFAKFREQACIIVCPYGRFQSALVDENTIAVTYDFKRGETRGHLTREDKNRMQEGAPLKTEQRGDCIDCHQCVDVCPTGIDIRNGIQLECVNCTACIDACDDVMDKINQPRGLVRYASLNSIKHPNNRLFSKRVVAYSGVLVVLMGLLGYFFSIRGDVEATILRQRGTLTTRLEEGVYGNFFQFNIVNKTFDAMEFDIRLLQPSEGSLRMITEERSIEGQTRVTGRFLISMPETALKGVQTPMKLGIFSGDKLLEEVKMSFQGPSQSGGR